MKSRKIKQKSILRAFTVLSTMTLISRITGYLRDAVIAAFLGASTYSDAFFVAFRIPNMFRRLFGEGALTPSIVPVVSGLINKPEEEKNREIKSIIGTAVLVVGIVTLLGVIFAPYFVKALAYGFTKNENLFSITVNLTRIMFPYLFFISLVVCLHGHSKCQSSFLCSRFFTRPFKFINDYLSTFFKTIFLYACLCSCFRSFNWRLIATNNPDTLSQKQLFTLCPHF